MIMLLQQYRRSRGMSSQCWRADNHCLLASALCGMLVMGCGSGSAPSATAIPRLDPDSVERKQPRDTPLAATAGVASSSMDGKSPSISRSSIPDQPVVPRVVHRPDDPRPRHDDAALASLGIHVYESRRLKLYTDIDPEQARVLPPMVDQLYPALEAYFGPLPPDRAGTDFQMTGYLIDDLALFRETGLVPEDLPTFEHGRHRANEFWLRQQDYDYYRAHLLLHEATHCFMTYMPNSVVNVWYMEGMAELFGTHRIGPDGSIDFGIMPSAPEEVAGWGRITLIRQAFAAGSHKTIPDLFAMIPVEFLEPLPYAWSWGLCEFLHAHPRYQARFKVLAEQARGPEFAQRFQEIFADDSAELATEWLLFVVNLQYGYDVARSAIEFRAGEPLQEEMPARTFEIASDRGWQSSGVELQQGATYRVTAKGRISLADEPKPWLSEPQGISIDYFDGQPIGRLLGCIRASDPALPETMLRVLPLGDERTFQAPVTGTLYLRVNDSWSRLADNRGTYSVTVGGE